MAIKRNKPVREKKLPNIPASDIPSPDELFVKPPEELPKIFSSPNYEITHKSNISKDLSVLSKIRQSFLKVQKFPITQKVLIVGIVISSALLIYSFFFSPSGPQYNPQTQISPKQAADINAAEPKIAQKEPNTIKVPQNTLAASIQTDLKAEKNDEEAITLINSQIAEATKASEPLSLRLVDELFTAKDYVRAYNSCNKLRQILTGKEFDLIRDFLYLRMAICMEKKSSDDKAYEMFRDITQSQSITIKILANHNLCLLEMNSGRYLRARTRAYKTIALTGAIASDYKWALNIERDCQFLAAESIARQSLSLSDADKTLPKQLWNNPDQTDPLSGYDVSELQSALQAGTERLKSGLLAPQIQTIDSSSLSSALIRWSAACNGPGIDEFIARFASNAGMDIKWAKRIDDKSGNEQQPSGWNRSVILYMPASTAQQIISTAAGSVGLLAKFNDINNITIFEPSEYYDLSEHTHMLNEYAIWIWRKLMLMYSEDGRVANAHFVLGLLQEQKGQTSEAISEYKIVANHYAKTKLAPVALLHSSRLKTALRDYPGAGRDLKQLIDQYPENELIGQAYLDLATNTMKAGMLEEACSQFRRAYSLSLNNDAKAVAALGAGKCFYQLKEYDSVLKWLNIYLESADPQQSNAKNEKSKPQPQNNPELYSVYLLIGKTHLALGNIQQACKILERTVKKANVTDDYAEAIATLTEAQIQQGDFLTALNIIENVRPWSFTQEQTTRLLLLKSAILRETGLPDQAITLLTDRIQYLTDAKLKAGVNLELARCSIAANQLDMARAYFSEAIPSLESGPASKEATVELAQVCLKLNDYKQAIYICKQLMETSVSQKIKEKAAKTLAAAYSSQQEYDKAAMALLNLQSSQNTTKENKTIDASEK